MKYYHVFMVFTTMVILTSCSTGLSRSNARKTILENLPKELRTVSVQFGRAYVNGRIEKPTARMNYNGWNDASIAEEMKISKQLIDGGLIIKTKGYQWSEKILPWVKISNDGYFYEISVAYVTDIEVSGIYDISENVKEVKCYVVYDWNELGKLARLEYILRIPHQFVFKKYDDGWRFDH